MTEPDHLVDRSVISSPGDQAAIWFLGALSQVRLSGEQTGGAFSLVENLNRRGNGSPVHVHGQEDETLVVLDGELRLFAGEQEHTAGPGTVAVLPRRLRHAYVVTSATARFLTCTSRRASSSSPPRSGGPRRLSRCRQNPQPPRTSPPWPRQPPGTTSRSWPRHPGPSRRATASPWHLLERLAARMR